MEPKLVTSIEHLKRLATNELHNGVNCYILLTGGGRSSKQIIYYQEQDKWWMFNENDGTEMTYKSTQALIEEYPFLIDAIAKQCFFYWPE